MPRLALDAVPAAGALRADGGAEAGARPHHDDGLALDRPPAATGDEAVPRQHRDRLRDRAEVVHEHGA